MDIETRYPSKRRGYLARGNRRGFCFRAIWIPVPRIRRNRTGSCTRSTPFHKVRPQGFLNGWNVARSQHKGCDGLSRVCVVSHVAWIQVVPAFVKSGSGSAPRMRHTWRHFSPAGSSCVAPDGSMAGGNVSAMLGMASFPCGDPVAGRCRCPCPSTARFGPARPSGV